VTFPPEILLGAAFAVFVLAAIVFVVVLARSLRDERIGNAQARMEKTAAAHPGVERPVDASLEGLDVALARELPTAALLAPLGSVPWAPADEPAPHGDLELVSLDGRIATFEPPQAADLPADAHEAWVVEPTGLAGLEPGERVGAVVAPWAELIPEVHSPDPTEQEASATPPIAQHETLQDEAVDPELEETLALLATNASQSPPPDDTLPPDVSASSSELPDSGPSSSVAASEPVFTPPAMPPVPAALWVPEPDPTPEQSVEAQPEGASAVEAPAEPDAQELDIAPAPAAMAESAIVIESEAVSPAEPASVPEYRIMDVPEGGATAVSGPVPGEDGEEAVTQRSLPEMTPAPVERPAVRVASVEPPITPVSEPAPAAPVRVRPVAHVRPEALEGLRPSEPAPVGFPAKPPDAPTGGRDSAPELVLAAPVEMWFGESRVGVRAGSATFDRFRKYADTLLIDLNATRDSSR